MRRIACVVVMATVGASLVSGDIAAAATCFTLQAELSHLQSRGGGTAGDRERYERAYQEQINVISRTEGRARDAGCFGSGFVFFEQQPDQVCSTLIPKLREMEVNLARLDRLRMSGDSGNADRIREIQGMMMDRGCGLPGDDWASEPGNEWTTDLDQSYATAGTFRTVCVRKCDGYYFPISYSTTSENFAADANTCASMCPSAETELYYYENPGGSPQSMTSIAGGNYADLPTAFRYRTSFDSSCTCGAGQFRPVTTALAESGEVPQDPTARLPRARPAPGEDPETLANRAGSFVPRVLSEEDIATAATAMTPGGRMIRVIGPVFGPSDQQREALLSPIPTEIEDDPPTANP